jgi:hypothetical protein
MVENEIRISESEVPFIAREGLISNKTWLEGTQNSFISSRTVINEIFFLKKLIADPWV